MAIFLKGWTSKGLRCPDMSINLPSFKKKSIALIQMPNGTGKTTVMELIEACLTEKSFTSNEVTSLKGQENESGRGEFSLHIFSSAYFGKPDREISITIRFDFAERSFEYLTLRDVGTGQERGWNPPSDLRTFLTPRCIEVFVFKGDKVENLLDSSKDDAEQSIKAFFRISRVAELITRINSSSIFDVQGPQTDKGITQRQNVLKKWLEQEKAMKGEKDRLEKDLSLRRKESAEIKEKVQGIIAGQTDLQTKLSDVDRKIAAQIVKVSSQASLTMRVLKNPLSLSSNLMNKSIRLVENLDQLKLPGTSKTFFEELVNQSDVCICDRPMTDNARSAILDKSKTYLGDEYISVVNGIKQDIKKYAQSAEDESAQSLISMLQNENNELRNLKSTKTLLLQQIETSADKEQKEILEKNDKLVAEIAKLESDLSEITGPYEEGTLKSVSVRNPDEIRSLAAIEGVIRLRNEELHVLNKTVSDFKKKERLQKCLDYASKIAHAEISKQVTSKSNEKLRALFPEGTPLMITNIGKHIQLGYNSHSQDKGSGAQNVAVAYSFASTLLEQSGAQFPLIVDHPVTALQESARRELGSVLPRVCNQFVGFVIDTEKIGFFESLQRTGSSIDTVTIFRNIEGNAPYLEMLPKSEQVSSNPSASSAVVSFDPEFFKQFRDLNPEASDRG